MERKTAMAELPALYTEVSVDDENDVNYVVLPKDVNKALRTQQLDKQDFTVFDDGLSTLFANFGGFHKLESQRQFSALSYSLCGCNDLLKITPIHLVDEIKWEIKSLCFKFPEPIPFNGITFNEFNDQIVMDVLQESGMLVTLVFDFESFTEKCHLSRTNVYDWCRFSLPSALGRRKPLFMKSLDSLNTLVSLTDGGLLLLSKSNPFDSFSVKLFTSTSYLESWNIFKSKWSKDTSIPEHAELGGETVSTKSIIDVISFTDEIFVTLSVNKCITFWSKYSQQVIKKFDLNDLLSKELHSAIISPYLPHSSLRITDNILSVFLPIDKTFVYLLDVDEKLDITLMKTLVPPVPNNSWLPLDFVVTSTAPGILEFWFSWYYGESELYHQCIINKTGNVEWNVCTNKSATEDIEIQRFIAEINSAIDYNGLNDYVSNFIKTKYSPDVLATSIELFCSHYNLELKSLSLNLQLEKVLNKCDDFQEYKKKVLRFTSVCHDVQTKSSNKMISLFVFENRLNNFVYVMKSRGYSILRKSTPFELLLFNAKNPQVSLANTALDFGDIDINNLLKLVNLILDYSSGFPSDAECSIQKRLSQLNSSSSVESSMSEIFESRILNVVNDTVVSNLLESLGDINNASFLFEYLVNLRTHEPTEYKPIENAQITSLGQSFLEQSIYYSNYAASKILFGLTLILLTIDISKPVVDLFKKANRNLSNINFINDVHQLSNHRFIVKYIKHLFNGGIYFGAINITKVLSILNGSLSSEPFVYYLMCNLLASSCEYDSDVAKNWCDYLPQNAIGHILHGVTLLESKQPYEAKELYNTNVEIITKYASSVKKDERSAMESLWDTVSLMLVPSTVDYYYNVSLLFEKYKYDQMALFFSMKALDLAAANSNKTITVGDILQKIFSVSLRLQEYNTAFNAISQMSRSDKVTPLRMFVYKLFEEGQLKELLYFDFGDDYVTIDELIWDMGENAIGVASKPGFTIKEERSTSSRFVVDSALSLKYYRICYALRMKKEDFRGAVEALHRFNSIILDRVPKLEASAYGKLAITVELKMVLENYLIILNLLETLPRDDRWLIKLTLTGSGRNTLLKFEDIQREYNQLRLHLALE